MIVPGDSAPVLGLYSDPQPLWDAVPGKTLADWGVNAIFQHSTRITPALVDRATREGARVFAEFATLRGDSLVTDHPKVWPIDATGGRVPRTERFLGACPSQPAMREAKFAALRKLVERFDLSGVWLDYLHFHCDFELPTPTMDQTCFCDDCLRAFTTATGIVFGGHDRAAVSRTILTHHFPDWNSWKVATISEWARQARQILDDARPSLLLGIYSCPWQDDEYGGALRSVLGVDIDSLSMIDVWSPMLYHRKCGRPTTWVADYTGWLATRLHTATPGRSQTGSPAVWPIVDAWETAPAEFATVLRGGLSPGSGGVQVFTSAYAATPERRDVLRDVYRAAADLGSR